LIQAALDACSIKRNVDSSPVRQFAAPRNDVVLGWIENDVSAKICRKILPHFRNF
jgi:hypothetical protein